MNPSPVNTPLEPDRVQNASQQLTTRLKVDFKVAEAQPGERLLELLNRTRTEIPQVCYHAQLGPIQTCDTCMVEANGKLVRAYATIVEPGMQVETNSTRAAKAQRDTFDHILADHMLYCTVCYTPITASPEASASAFATCAQGRNGAADALPGAAVNDDAVPYNGKTDPGC